MLSYLPCGAIEPIIHSKKLELASWIHSCQSPADLCMHRIECLLSLWGPCHWQCPSVISAPVGGMPDSHRSQSQTCHPSQVSLGLEASTGLPLHLIHTWPDLLHLPQGKGTHSKLSICMSSSCVSCLQPSLAMACWETRRVAERLAPISPRPSSRATLAQFRLKPAMEASSGVQN